jgi:Mrp family chromosome partitioning ATPase
MSDRGVAETGEVGERVDRRMEDAVGLLRRRRLFLLAGAVLALLFAGAGVLGRPVSYAATARVLVTPTGVDESAVPANGQGTKVGVNLDTEAKLLFSPPVVARAKTLLGSSLPDPALTGGVQVKVPASSQILAISYRARSAGKAQRGAQAFATGYLDARRELAAKNLAGQITSVQQQLTALRAGLTGTARKLAATPRQSADRAVLQAEADVLTSQLSALSDRLSTLQSTPVTPGRIIVNALVPTAPAGPPAILLLAAAVLVGLAIVVVLAVLRDRADPRLYTAAAVERRTGTPAMLDLTGLPDPTGVPDFGLYITAARPGLVSQEFRRLQNTLTAALPDRGRVILVTAASAEGPSGAVAANLAGALARGGSTAILLCADPNSRTGAALVGYGSGLAEALAGNRPLADLLRPLPAMRSLRIAPQGIDTNLLPARLQSAAAGELVDAARGLADYVVIELAPAATSADAQTMARWSDAAIIVVEAGRTRTGEVRAAIEQLAQVGLERVGCAFVPGVHPDRDPQPVRLSAPVRAAIKDAKNKELAGRRAH